MIEKVTKASQKADAVASADAYLIPKLMYPNNASWMLSFARNAEVIAYNNTTSDYGNGDHGRQLVRHPRPPERQLRDLGPDHRTPAATARSC